MQNTIWACPCGPGYHCNLFAKTGKKDFRSIPHVYAIAQINIRYTRRQAVQKQADKFNQADGKVANFRKAGNLNSGLQP